MTIQIIFSQLCCEKRLPKGTTAAFNTTNSQTETLFALVKFYHLLMDLFHTVCHLLNDLL